MSTYTHEITAFDRWVAENFAREHLDEIESYQRAASEYGALFRRGLWPLLSDEHDPP